MSIDPPGVTEFNTLTHARLRAAQGDVRGAREILVRMLEQDAEPGEARALLRRLDGGCGKPTRARIDRLEAWLRRVRRNAGGPGD